MTMMPWHEIDMALERVTHIRINFPHPLAPMPTALIHAQR